MLLPEKFYKLINFIRNIFLIKLNILKIFLSKIKSLNLDPAGTNNINILKNNKAIKIFAAILIVIFLFSHVVKSIFNFKFNSSSPFVVVAAPVLQKDVNINVKASGRVQPISTVIIKPQIDGIILNSSFIEGKIVHKGQLLFEIEPASLQAMYNQAVANLARSKADLQNADLQLQKYKKLYKNSFVSDQDYQQIVANFKMMEASSAAASAALDAAKVQLNFTKIYSPIHGVAGQILVDTGNAIKAASGVALVSINQVHPINVLFNIPEEHLSQLIKNINNLDKLAIKLPEFDNVGKLVFFDNQVNSLNGTIALKAEFCNCDLSLWPGQFVNISLTINKLSNALVVPTRAVQVGQQGTYVYVAQKTKNKKKSYYATAKKTFVTTGAVLKNETVITNGLQPGQIVVTEGHAHLIDNSIVEIYDQ